MSVGQLKRQVFHKIAREFFLKRNSKRALGLVFLFIQETRQTQLKDLFETESAAGRGPGAALGVIAVVTVAIATYCAYRLSERERDRRSRGGIVAGPVP